MSVVVADSTPVRGLVSVAAVPDAQVLILRLAVVTGCPLVSLQGKVIQCSTSAKSWRHAAALAVTATLLAACGGGIQRRRRGRRSAGGADTTLTLVAYAVPEPGWSKIIPAFAATAGGQGRGGHHVLRRLG